MEYTVDITVTKKKTFVLKSESEEEAKNTIAYIYHSGQMDFDVLDETDVDIQVIGVNK